MKNASIILIAFAFSSFTNSTFTSAATLVKPDSCAPNCANELPIFFPTISGFNYMVDKNGKVTIFGQTTSTKPKVPVTELPNTKVTVCPLTRKQLTAIPKTKLFNGVDLRNCTFIGNTVTKWEFMGCNLNGTKFFDLKATKGEVNVYASKMEGTTFSGSTKKDVGINNVMFLRNIGKNIKFYDYHVKNFIAEKNLFTNWEINYGGTPVSKKTDIENLYIGASKLNIFRINNTTLSFGFIMDSNLAGSYLSNVEFVRIPYAYDKQGRPYMSAFNFGNDKKTKLFSGFWHNVFDTRGLNYNFYADDCIGFKNVIVHVSATKKAPWDNVKNKNNDANLCGSLDNPFNPSMVTKSKEPIRETRSVKVTPASLINESMSLKRSRSIK